MSAYSPEPLFSAAAEWDLFDVNARVGPSGVYGELALDTAGLLEEMDRFYIRAAVVSHFTAQEYDANVGNDALERDLHPRLTPAWAGLPEKESLVDLEARRPAVVRLTPATAQHNFAPAAWCAGPLFEYLQANNVLTLIARTDIEWNALVSLVENFPRLRVVLLETGYRADRHLFPLLERFPMLHFDSATYLAHRQLEAYVERHGPDRLLFGSRLPLYTPGSSLAVLASARISDHARRAIAGGNLRRLLANASTT
ncbi:MAG TPA: amidohydrolase family protein [Bryobacteraceae bacterium]|nr:amidohydrolase family protein [Bryobacteraceae bacterium]